MTTNRLSLAMRNVLVAIDDTDNLDSRGTGHLSRQLARHLDELGAGSPLAVTRHQLFVDDRIPYTSHNSSACIALHCPQPADVDAIVAAGGAFLEQHSAPGSDPGLAVATEAVWTNAATLEALRAYGMLAKHDVLDQDAARTLASSSGIHLSAHGGDGGGIIGALAAIGLHAGGADGRILWMPHMRELTGDMTYRGLRAAAPIDAALDPAGREPAPDDVITLGDWVRPILRDGRAVLLLDPAASGSGEDRETTTTWAAAPREVVKTH
jgi:hypothetical protein